MYNTIISWIAMRTNEYLEIAKQQIYHFELVEKAVEGLYPLRLDHCKTEEYLNRYHFADARKRVVNDFQLREGEVDPTIALEVRLELMKVLAQDNTFIFAHNILAEGRNRFWNHPLLCIGVVKGENGNTLKEIEELYKNLKEDYPKDNLADYLLNDQNRCFYDEKRQLVNHDEIWWLDAFNRAYRLFDIVRVKNDNPFNAKVLVTDFATGDEEMDQLVVDIFCSLAEHFDFGQHDEQRKKMDLLLGMLRDDVLQEDKYEVRKVIAQLKEELKEKEDLIAEKEEELNGLKNKTKATAGQIIIFFYYLLHALGINFNNSDKTKWANMISFVSGYNKEYIRNRLEFSFDNGTVKQNIRIVAGYLQELLPLIALQMQNDLDAEEEKQKEKEKQKQKQKQFAT